MAKTNFKVHWVALFLVGMATESASAQVGRLFASAEAFATVSRVVHVGKIVKLERITYEKPLTWRQKLGKPHRLTFQVSETIRGVTAKRLDLVLSLQSTIYLEYMRDHATELLLVAAPFRLDRAEVGIEEQGKELDDDSYSYHFRPLDALVVPNSDAEAAIASQINMAFDSGRMFADDLAVVTGSKEILPRVRAFAKKYPKTLSSVMLRVPNEFGSLCGYPNAFCLINLPVCPETQSILLALQGDPGLILRRIPSRDETYNRSLLKSEVDKCLAEFQRKVQRPDESPFSHRWVDSDDGKIAMRLSASETLTKDAPIKITVEMRNRGKDPVRVLRPFGDWLDTRARGFKIWEDNHRIRYSGPIPDYDVLADQFAIIPPGATIHDQLELTKEDFAGMEAPGTYRLRYDYAYHGGWDKTAGVRDVWRGTISSFEIQVTRSNSSDAAEQGVSPERRIGPVLKSRSPIRSLAPLFVGRSNKTIREVDCCSSLFLPRTRILGRLP